MNLTNNYNHKCLVILGSNSDAPNKLDAAIKAIAEHLDIISTGTRILTEPEDDISLCPQTYTNQAIIIKTDRSPQEIVSIFKEIERQNGRTPESKMTGIVPLDIDLLTYDEQTLRPSDMEKTYVKSAIAALAQ